MRDLDTRIETVQAFLDARRLRGKPTALVAPRDATVIDIGQRWIVPRTPDDRCSGCGAYRARSVTPWSLYAWGEHRLAEHVMDEFSLMFGNKVPRVYWSLALRPMLHGGKLRGIGALARVHRAR